jgi:hypothetical protein
LPVLVLVVGVVLALVAAPAVVAVVVEVFVEPPHAASSRLAKTARTAAAAVKVGLGLLVM